MTAASRLRLQHSLGVNCVLPRLSLDIIPYRLIPWAFGLIKEGV